MHALTFLALAGAVSSSLAMNRGDMHIHTHQAAGGRLRRATVKSDAIVVYDLDDSPMVAEPNVTGVSTKATGKARVTYVPSVGIIAAKVSYKRTDSPLIGLHFHQGNKTTNGPVMVNFCSQPPLPAALTNGSNPCAQKKYGVNQWYLGTPWTGYDEKKVRNLLLKDTKNTYFNLHTTKSFEISGGNGLIRHQTMKKGMTTLVPVGVKAALPNVKKAKLYAFELAASPQKALPAVTNVTSNATGAVTVSFIPSLGLFVADVTYSGIDDEVIGMHLHAGNSTTNGAPLVVFCGSAPLPDILVNFTISCQQNANGKPQRYVGNLVQGTSLKMVTELLIKTPQDAYFNIHDLRSFQIAGANGLIRQQTSIGGGFEKAKKNWVVI